MLLVRTAHTIALLTPPASGSPEACAQWTGRSAMSSITDTALSRFATSGARCTRLSAMRPSRTRSNAGAFVQRRRALGPMP